MHNKRAFLPISCTSYPIVALDHCRSASMKLMAEERVRKALWQCKHSCQKSSDLSTQNLCEQRERVELRLGWSVQDFQFSEDCAEQGKTTTFRPLPLTSPCKPFSLPASSDGVGAGTCMGCLLQVFRRIAKLGRTVTRVQMLPMDTVRRNKVKNTYEGEMVFSTHQEVVHAVNYHGLMSCPSPFHISASKS
eukprot:746522-Hanusia_phi.AAC.3